MNILLTFHIEGGILHPDSNHLGSRIHGKAKIIEYESDKIVMVVKPHYNDYIKEYVPDYLKRYNVTVTLIDGNVTELYEHQTVY